jgi:hypothetical protein
MDVASLDVVEDSGEATFLPPRFRRRTGLRLRAGPALA